MTGYDGMAGSEVANVTRPGRARTACTGGAVRIIAVDANGGGPLAGVVIDLSTAEPCILLVDGEGRTILSMGPFDEEDVIATWRSISDASGLTPMMRAGGETTALGSQLGSVRLGSRHTRRRIPLLGRRRPRFLIRRKSARLPLRPLIYREREIASGTGT